MFTSFLTSGAMLTVTRTPGAIVGPIARFMGVIYNALFNFIYSFLQSGSLAVAIILFTLLVKLILTPLMAKQLHSSYKMQKLQPEMNKIKAKYANKKDQESQQRMAYEIQEFQKKNGISLFGGCLPLLIQLPILYALFYVFQQPYLYVDVIGQNYNSLANAILDIPVQLRVDILKPIAEAKKMTMDLAVQQDIVGLVNVLSSGDWEGILAQLTAQHSDIVSQFTILLAEKTQIEYVFGLNLVSKAGLGFPGIIVPLAAGGTTYLQTVFMTKSQNLDPNDPTASTMKMMNMIMPIMMGVMTISMPAALGLYWTISNVFTIAQQMIMTKIFKSRDERESKEAA